MARVALISGAAALALVGVLGASTAQNSPVDPVEAVLSGIDFVPGRSTLDQAAAPASAEDDLLALAADENGATDPGIRARAIRALGDYPGTETVAVLRGVLSENAAQSGTATLHLRAAAEALAVTAGADAVSDLADLLTHPSRDVRATAARALATTGSPLAVPRLRERLGVEPTVQVRLALSTAIRQLTGTPLPGSL